VAPGPEVVGERVGEERPFVGAERDLHPVHYARPPNAQRAPR
jgi:hypothetical protein